MVARPVMNVFISHSWSYSEHYDRLSEWLFRTMWTVGRRAIQFRDTSVPKDNPIQYAPNAADLEAAINERIVASDVLVIPTGMYASYSKWIGKEIAGAQIFQRPIVAVDLWGSQRSSSVVIQAADEVVGWNKNSVIAAVWRLGTRRAGFGRA